jgi:hypothetical protein
MDAKTSAPGISDARRTGRYGGLLGRPWRLSPVNRRRWTNFKANRRGYWSLWIFLGLFGVSLFANLIANDKPLLVSYKGELLLPVLIDYPEEKFGGFLAVTDYKDPVIADEISANGWMIWPPIRYSYSSPATRPPAIATGSAPTIRDATSSPASSTAFACRSSSACCSPFCRRSSALRPARYRATSAASSTSSFSASSRSGRRSRRFMSS